GRRAHERRDLHAAASLLRRARALAEDGSHEDRRLGLDLASALAEAGEFDDARAVLRDVEDAAAAAGDEVATAHARVDLASIAESLDPEGASEATQRAGIPAMAIFEAAGDDVGMAKAWAACAEPDHKLARWEPYREAHERALVHLRRTGDRMAISETLGWIAHAVTHGPTPVREAVARVDSILIEVSDDRVLWASVQARRGLLLALAGDRGGALAAEAEAEAVFADIGNDYNFGSFGLAAGATERVLGCAERSEQTLRRADAVYERAGERSVRSTALAELAYALVLQEKFDDAGKTAQLALELGSSDDATTVCVAEAVLAGIDARRGDTAAVERCAAAVALGEKTDMLWMQGELWTSHAEVLDALGRRDEAHRALGEALARYERKGATMLAERTRR